MNILQNPDYKPNKLFDSLLDDLKLKNDAALAQALDVAPPVMSKIRHYKLPIGASLLVRIHDLTDLPIKAIRERMGIVAE